MVKESGSSRGIPENSDRVPLSQRERTIILFAAQGKTIQDTSRALFLSEDAVKRDRLSVFGKLGVKKIDGAIMFALRRGDILPEEVLPVSYDMQKLNNLSPYEQRVLDTLTEEGRTQTLNEDIGNALSLHGSSIKSHLGRIATKLGSSGREQTVAIAVSIQLLEQKTLTALPSAIYQEDVTEILKRRFHRQTLARLQQQFATTGIFDTIFAGIRTDKIDSDKLVVGFDGQKLSKLKPEHINLLTRLIKGGGKSSTYTRIAQETGVTANDVARQFAQIRDALEIAIHPAVLYYALQYKNLPR